MCLKHVESLHMTAVGLSTGWRLPCAMLLLLLLLGGNSVLELLRGKGNKGATTACFTHDAICEAL